ncbi:MAG: hypothetical protein R3B81_05335 [bacterium]
MKSMKRWMLMAAATFHVAGCSTTEFVARDPVDPTTRVEINRKAAGHDPRIRLEGDETHSFVANDFRIDDDGSFSWALRGDSQTRSTRELRSASFRDPEKGALTGLVAGAAIGAAVGLMVANSDDGCDETSAICVELNPLGKMLIMAGFSALGGVLVGLPVGAAAGSQVTYDFYDSGGAPPDTTSTGPSPGIY